MDTSKEMHIAISKGKAIALVLGSIALVAVGIRLLTLDDARIRTIAVLPSPLLAHAVGLLGIAFFGLCAVLGVRKLFDAKPGLTLDATGLVDNASGASAGFIPWGDISGSCICEVINQTMLVINLVDPEKYIQSGGRLRRWINRKNFNICGSPVAIGPNTLKIDFANLVSTLEAYRLAHGNHNQAPPALPPS